MSRNKHNKQVASRKSTPAQLPNICIFQLGSSDTGEELPKHGVYLYSHSSSPYLLCVSLDKLLVIDSSDRELYAEYKATEDMFSSVIEYTGLILVGSVLGYVYSISLANFHCSPPIHVHDGSVIQLIAHPVENTWIASIGGDGYLKLINMQDDMSKFKRVHDRFLLQLKISGEASAMSFSPQGDWLLTSYDNGIRAWEIERKNLSKDKRFRKTAPPFSVQLYGSKFHQSTVERIVFIRDDVVASKDKIEQCVLLWKFDIDADVWRMSSNTIEHEPTLLYTVACDFSAFDYIRETSKLVVAMDKGVVRILPLLFDEEMESDSDVTVSVRFGTTQDLPGPDQPITGIYCLHNKILVGLANNCVVVYAN
ncbi:Leucine-rich repeat and WD repeat-containing protein 1-like isoform X1 [Oopsacas minuta]|uniref:Leucine-rich repeat and WD repeat-containing protein 1-like isoform X1 n=1 Tax=Oopsacas minuta TaxID=111878 RepID=A0AAV7K8V0_9METZ|nr:Leucine-rich repeat and WD repeat-containing protein 1-like isoform X1 [Oopsacas minuta]